MACRDYSPQTDGPSSFSCDSEKDDNAGDADATADGYGCIEDEFNEYDSDDGREDKRHEEIMEADIIAADPGDWYVLSVCVFTSH